MLSNYGARETINKSPLDSKEIKSVNSTGNQPWIFIGKGKKESEVTQSCLTLCDPMDCSLPGSSVNGILEARMLEWVAISFSRGSSWPRDWTQVSRIVGRRFTVWATREAHSLEGLKDWCKAEAPILWPTATKSWLTGEVWCWQGLKSKWEGGSRGWDGEIASLIQWTWVWANLGR